MGDSAGGRQPSAARAIRLRATTPLAVEETASTRWQPRRLVITAVHAACGRKCGEDAQEEAVCVYLRDHLVPELAQLAQARVADDLLSLRELARDEAWEIGLRSGKPLAGRHMRPTREEAEHLPHRVVEARSHVEAMAPVGWDVAPIPGTDSHRPIRLRDVSPKDPPVIAEVVIEIITVDDKDGVDDKPPLLTTGAEQHK